MEISWLFSAFVAAWYQISPLLLNLFIALIVLLVGFFIAKGVGFAVASFLKLAQLDRGAKQIGFNSILEKAEIRRSISELIGDLVYWTILFIAIIGLGNLFYLPIEPALSNVFAYLSLVFIAAIILGFGLFFASLFAGIIKTIALNFGLDGAKALSRVIYYILIIFSFLAALAQLGIKTEVFVPQIGVIIGAVGLAAAIAFGLGCKDMAADFLHNLFKGK